MFRQAKDFATKSQEGNEMPTKRVMLAALGFTAMFLLVPAVPAGARGIAKRERVQLASFRAAKLEADCCVPKQACCPDPCIVYRNCGPKLCCGCDPPKEIVLQVKDPCTGCVVNVPICLPACCKGEPKVCYGSGLLCRDVVSYDWCCGFNVKIVFRKRGDLLVRTWGY
jgi:hypothetical protein